MKIISATILSFFVLAISLPFFPKCNGKSRPSPYKYRRVEPATYPTSWRSHGGSAGGVLGGLGGEQGDLGISRRSSRTVALVPQPLPLQQQQPLSSQMGFSGLRIAREVNYWGNYFNSKPNYHSACEYSCDDGTCLKKEYKCDGYAQCWDGSDERNCTCAKIINEAKLCDLYEDCPHGEDEKDCVYGCQANEFTCDTHNSGSKVKCVSMTKRCDGYEDCPHGNDEHNCFRMVDLYGEEERGVMSNGILQKRVGENDWHTVCKTSGATKYIAQFAQKACDHIIGHVDEIITVTTKSLSQIKLKMTQKRKQELKYVRLAEVEAKFAVLGSCASDLVYNVECPEPQCGGHGNYYNYGDDLRRRRRRDVDPLNDDVIDVDDLGTGLDEEDDVTELIVGGYASEEMKWPFLVGIFRDGEFYCGGSIINQWWIMTAGHCCHGYEGHVYEVQAGMTRRLSWSPYEQSRMVSEIHVHENYNSKIFANDIALYKLDKPLYFSKYVTPACLPTSVADDPQGGAGCKVAGWGDLSESGSGPDHMQEVELPILSKCKETFTRDSHQICAGYPEGLKDACQGDSGGPLLCWNSLGKPIVNGVVSFGRGCARANEAGAYTRVSAYLDWISKIISEESSSSYTRRPKQCTETCYKPGGQCLFPGNKCGGNVDCLGAEDELGCTQKITRSKGDTPQYYSPYYTRPQQHYNSPESGMQRSGGSSAISHLSPQPPSPPITSYYPMLPMPLPGPSPPTLQSPPPKLPEIIRDYPFLKERAREAPKVGCTDSEFKCATRPTDKNGQMVECTQKTNECNRICDCMDKSDETECLTMTSNFHGEMSPSSLTKLNKVKGYVLTRFKGSQWYPLVTKTWTLAMGQQLCQSLMKSESAQLESLETIGLQEMAKVLDNQPGLNMLNGQAVKLDGDYANMESGIGYDSEKMFGHPAQLSKIDMKSDNAAATPETEYLNNYNKSDSGNNDLMIAFVRCAKP